MAADTQLLNYTRRFTLLRRSRNTRLGDAPHKPILLLAILDGIERGYIRENRIGLTPELVAAFRIFWRALVPADTWQERIIYPFRYMVSEGFWELIKDGLPIDDADLGHPTSISQFVTRADHGRLTPDLWTLLFEHADARAMLRSALLDTYFPNRAATNQPITAPADPLALEAERLITQAAETRFRPRPLPRAEQEADGTFVRHYLFPRVVTALYDYSCSVCRLGVKDDMGGSLVDAAHILPFAKFHNDDPRNGIALCKNHHWGFDRGWFTVTSEFRVKTSARVTSEGSSLVDNGALLTLPTDPRYAPALDALAWHHANIFRR